MAKIQNAANSTEESIGIAMSRTELFFEKNGKALTLGLIVLVLLGGLWVGYRNLVSKPRHEKAAELLAQAQNKFEADDADYTVALNGDDNGAGFLEVIERYGSTPAGNLAICYLKEGDLKNAAAYLAKYTPVKGIPGSVVNAQNYGLQGDIAVDEGNYKEAVKFFEKAVEAADNNATAPIFLMKAGRAYKALGDTAVMRPAALRV
jgi:tetratricopeptide (TPR) repeat protein